MALACEPAPALRRHRFTVDDVDRMAAAGVFAPDERVELLDGEIVDVSPPGPEHAAIDGHVADMLRQAFAEGFHVRDQQPLQLDASSRPEPDLAVVRGKPLDWYASHPSGRDAVLVVEVSWTSQAIDRAKAALYAAGGVRTYWLLDAEARTLAVHTDPGTGGYGKITTLDEHDEVELPACDLRLPVGALLP